MFKKSFFSIPFYDFAVALSSALKKWKWGEHVKKLWAKGALWEKLKQILEQSIDKNGWAKIKICALCRVRFYALGATDFKELF